MTPSTSARPISKFTLGLPPRLDNPDPLHGHLRQDPRGRAAWHGKKACMHCGSAAFAAGAVKRGFDFGDADLRPAVDGRRARRHLDDLKAALAWGRPHQGSRQYWSHQP
ncbi:MAG: hypothetical protein IPI73_31010 [Betaproteobacteria bacterium]|nr:hypothetical protein [Betaproteobacteria bacterium]